MKNEDEENFLGRKEVNHPNNKNFIKIQIHHFENHQFYFKLLAMAKLLAKRIKNKDLGRFIFEL